MFNRPNFYPVIKWNQPTRNRIIKFNWRTTLHRLQNLLFNQHSNTKKMEMVKFTPQKAF